MFAMMAGLPRTNCWSIAEHAGEHSPRGMQRFLSSAVWDQDAVLDDVRSWVVEHLGEPEAVLVVDETGDVKKGTLCRYRHKVPYADSRIMPKRVGSQCTGTSLKSRARHNLVTAQHDRLLGCQSEATRAYGDLVRWPSQGVIWCWASDSAGVASGLTAS